MLLLLLFTERTGGNCCVLTGMSLIVLACLVFSFLSLLHVKFVISASFHSCSVSVSQPIAYLKNVKEMKV